MNFGFVVLVGFIVGAAATGRIFYNFTLDNLRHFGVFKAMGATDRMLRRMSVPYFTMNGTKTTLWPPIMKA